jgi:hypothetical protein
MLCYTEIKAVPFNRFFAEGGKVLKKKFLLSLAILFACVFSVPIFASADTGPKASVSVCFQNMKQKNCYVTLLAEETSTGPYSVPASEEYYSKGDNPEVWQKFYDYRDPDGYHFLQYYQKLDDNSMFRWGYHPPVKFKILLYFPDYDTFAVSREAYERYAFNSSFAVDASIFKEDPVSDGTTFSAAQNYDFKGNAISLCVRILITIAIELLIALPFGYRAKQQLIFITLVNVITQIILNLAMNLVNFKCGSMVMEFYTVLLEIVVFAIEAAIYSHSAALVKYTKPEKKLHPVLYALAANAASYAAGLGLFFVFPQFF